jgi:hypothetical protein
MRKRFYASRASSLLHYPGVFAFAYLYDGAGETGGLYAVLPFGKRFAGDFYATAVDEATGLAVAGGKDVGDNPAL